MKKTQWHKILDVLLDGLWHSATELSSNLFITQHGARIKELKENGLNIVNKRYQDMTRYDKRLFPKKYDYLDKIESSRTFYRLTTRVELINYEKHRLKTTIELDILSIIASETKRTGDKGHRPGTIKDGRIDTKNYNQEELF